MLWSSFGGLMTVACTTDDAPKHDEVSLGRVACDRRYKLYMNISIYSLWSFRSRMHTVQERGINNK